MRGTTLFVLTIALARVGCCEVTVEDMEQLGTRVASGEAAALEELDAVQKKLYRNIDFEKEQSRVRSNLVLMRAAFNVVGEEAGKGNESALKALVLATGRSGLQGFTGDAFGIAAGKGSEEALNVLLNHKAYGLLLSSTVFALRYSAERNEPRAVKFLVGVLRNPGSKALWHGASEALVGAANAGNEDATKALEEYAKTKDPGTSN